MRELSFQGVEPIYSPTEHVLFRQGGELFAFRFDLDSLEAQGQAVSIDGGLSPIWSSDGTDLYFRQGSKVMSVQVTLTPEVGVSPPVLLFDGPFTLDLSGHQRYDVAPDGRFLMVENSEDFRVVVVEGFFEELQRLVPID